MTTWKTQHHDIYDNTESHKASSPPAWHSNGSSSPSSSDISSANEDKTVRTTTPRSARKFGHPNPSHHGGDETTACDLTDESIGVDGMDMESNGHFCGRRETWRRFPRDSGGARACLCYDWHLRDNAKAAQYSLQDSGMEDVTTTRRRHDRLCLLGRPIRRWLAGPRTVRRASQKNGWRVCCEGVVAALRFTWSALWMSFMLICMGLAVLFTFWALFPVCTRCRHHHHAPLGGSQYATAAVFAGALQEAGSSPLYINQLQVIGTHNSYHRRTNVPAAGRFWRYRYPSLTEQLDRGVRHLELDIHYDIKTGTWFVYHLSVLDAMTTCSCLSECLAEISRWSNLHPEHHVLFIEIELKIYGDFLRICGDKTPDTNKEAFLEMQRTVLDGFSRDRILTPRDVRGDYPSLTEAVKSTLESQDALRPVDWDDQDGTFSSNGSTGDRGARGESGAGERGGVMEGGWPKVDESRGMVLFVIDYQSINTMCRYWVRKALPDDETVFFERVPAEEVDESHLAAFTEVQQNVHDDVVISLVTERGFIVRRRLKSYEWASGEGDTVDQVAADGSLKFLAETPAQLLVADDLTPVKGEEEDEDAAAESGALPCRTRCTSVVPAEECILEGFC